MDKIHFDAIPLPPEQIETKFMNELANGNGGVTRRIALAILSKPSDHYYQIEMSEEDGEAFLSMVDPLTDYLNLLQAHLEMITAARARLFAILGYHFE